MKVLRRDQNIAKLISMISMTCISKFLCMRIPRSLQRFRNFEVKMFNTVLRADEASSSYLVETSDDQLCQISLSQVSARGVVFLRALYERDFRVIDLYFSVSKHSLYIWIVS